MAKRGGIPRMLTSTMVPGPSRPGSSRSDLAGVSRISRPKSAASAASAGSVNVPQEEAFEMPGFSVPIKKKKKKEVIEKEKKRMIRRNKPQGEDLKKMKEIVRSIRGEPINVHEFVGLISPSTGDDGELLRLVLAEELTAFRTTSRKIYETMSQDISDVLTNEHIQLTENTNERINLYTEKMMRSINEIYQLCPDFDFEQYYTKPGYLKSKFPLAPKLTDNTDELMATMRQEAYHRYQWLKSEGERFKEENTKLTKRLGQLKRQQREELKASAQRELEAEQARLELENKQDELEEKLEELNESVEKALVDNEGAETDKVVKLERKPKPAPDKLPRARQPKQQKPEWALETAIDIETSTAARALKGEVSKVSMLAKSSKCKVHLGREKKKKVAPKRSKSPFHFSPIKTPPWEEAGPARSPSPFHYSPPKTPPPGGSGSPGRVRVETSASVVENASPHGTRTARQPRDTWGGFQ